LPWILQLHINREQGIGNFPKLNKISHPIMYEDPFDLDYTELLEIVDKDVKMSSMFAW
jgi:hypothetical protein